MSNLIKIIQYIVKESAKLKDKYTDEVNAKIEFVDIFSKNSKEYEKLIKEINKLGKVVYKGPTGNIFSLVNPLDTIAGKLQFVKIRKPDDKLKLRGDADFNTNYLELKQKFKDHPNFELIIRDKFEMLRLSDDNSNIMACFSNIPVKIWVKS